MEGDNNSDKENIKYAVTMNGDGVFLEEYEEPEFDTEEDAKKYACELYSKSIKHPTQRGGRTFDIHIQRKNKIN